MACTQFRPGGWDCDLYKTVYECTICPPMATKAVPNDVMLAIQNHDREKGIELLMGYSGPQNPLSEVDAGALFDQLSQIKDEVDSPEFNLQVADAYEQFNLLNLEESARRAGIGAVVNPDDARNQLVNLADRLSAQKWFKATDRVLKNAAKFVTIDQPEMIGEIVGKRVQNYINMGQVDRAEKFLARSLRSIASNR